MPFSRITTTLPVWTY